MKQVRKHLFCVFLCVIMLSSMLPVQAAEKKNSGSTNKKMEQLIQFQPIVGSVYNFSLKKAHNVCISNKKLTNTGVVYMEYEVGKVTEDTTNQTLLACASGPSVMIPGGIGQNSIHYTNYKQGEGSPLLVEGARYYICFAKRVGGFEIYAQKYHKGKYEAVKLPYYEDSKWNDAFEYFTLFFGEERSRSVSCTFKNFKCYDGNGNDLGIQLDIENTQKGVEILQSGLMDDTTICEAAYFCKEKPELGMIVLGKNQKGYVEKNGKKQDFKYAIYGDGEKEATLYLHLSGEKQIHNYRYLQIIDEKDHIYTRLRNVKVTFVTDGQEVTEKVTLEDGYRIKEPEAPQKEGAKFLGWYLGNDEKFDFNSIVTESVSLYAKWDEKIEYQEVVGDDVFSNSEDANPPIGMLVGVSIVMLSGCAICSVLMLRRKRHEEK